VHFPGAALKRDILQRFHAREGFADAMK